MECLPGKVTKELKAFIKSINSKKIFCCPKKYFKYAWERLEKVASNEKYSEANGLRG